MVQTTNTQWLKGSNLFLITTSKPLASAGGFLLRLRADPNELEMKNIKVTINNLMEFADGIVQGANVTFTVLQAGKVLVDDSLSGKATVPYERNYEVMGSDADLVVEHNRPDLPHLSITAAIV